MVAMVFKCFNCLQTYVATVVFGYFKSRSGVASLIPTFCCIVSPDASRASQPGPSESEAPPPFPSCRFGRRRPLVECETECSARASVRMSER